MKDITYQRSAGWDCAKLIQVCLVPLASCLFIFMNMCIYELSLHSLSQHATPPVNAAHYYYTSAAFEAF